ncbi:MAG: YqcC family protein [Pseudomonadales bacterium]|nr:YqcC family protein [Pseudomonadales bacterium]
MDDVRKQLANLLLAVEKELCAMQLWDQQIPSAEALASSQPFAIDKLSFNQWLQFIFLPNMAEIIDSVETTSALPESCSIAPMAEEFYKAEPVDAISLIRYLGAIDALICDQ